MKGKAYICADTFKESGKAFYEKSKPVIKQITSTALQVMVEQVIKLCLDVASKIRILVVTRPYGQNTAQMQLELIEQKLRQFNMKEEKIC